MSYYNHFSDKKYDQVCFGSLKIGEKFRIDRFAGKRRRKDIVMVKTGELECEEFKSKKKSKFQHSAVEVSCYDKRII